MQCIHRPTILQRCGIIIHRVSMKATPLKLTNVSNFSHHIVYRSNHLSVKLKQPVSSIPDCSEQSISKRLEFIPHFRRDPIINENFNGVILDQLNYSPSNSSAVTKESLLSSELVFSGKKTKSNEPDQHPEDKQRESLQTIKYYIEEHLSQFFDTNFLLKYHNPRLYSKYIVLENEIQNPPKVTKGLVSLVWQLKLYQWYYAYHYKIRRLVITRIEVDYKMALIETHFRVRCFNERTSISTKSENFEETIDNLLEKRGEWHDYRLVCHVNNKTKITRILLTQLTRGQSPKTLSARMSFIERLKSLVGRVPRPISPMPAAVQQNRSKSSFKKTTVSTS